MNTASTIYGLLARLLPQRADLPQNPRYIVLILPCCIGDVVLGTAALAALRRLYPQAQITWAVGSWSRPALEEHPLLDTLLDTGAAALPVRTPRGWLRFVRQLRAGHYDLAVSLVRSPLMSLAVWGSGIRWRAGLDSAGRGLGYNLRVPIDPQQARHEAEIYLQVVRRLGGDTTGLTATVPVQPVAQARVAALLAERGISTPYCVLNPAGGRNPGMLLDVKRYPPEQCAALADRLAAAVGAAVVLLGGPDDHAIVAAVRQRMQTPPAAAFVGELSFAEIAALAAGARVYIGNDTGLTHLAAAAGATTLMILGPSDPARYAPFAPNARAVWKPAALVSGGVAAGAPADWDWARDGVSVDEALAAALALIHGGA